MLTDEFDLITAILIGNHWHPIRVGSFEITGNADNPTFLARMQMEEGQAPYDPEFLAGKRSEIQAWMLASPSHMEAIDAEAIGVPEA